MRSIDFTRAFELGEVDGLRDVVVGASLESLDLVLGRIERRLHDDRDEREASVGLHTPRDFDAVDMRHHHVEENQIGRGLGEACSASSPSRRTLVV